MRSISLFLIATLGLIACERKLATEPETPDSDIDESSNAWELLGPWTGMDVLSAATATSPGGVTQVLIGTEYGLYSATQADLEWSVRSSPGSNIWHLTVVGETLIATDGMSAMISQDFGETWEYRKPLSVAAGVRWLAHAGGSLFLSYDYHGLVRTDDLGVNWTFLGTNAQYLKAIDDRLYAGVNNVLLVSTDKGNSWTTVRQSSAIVTALESLGNGFMILGTSEGVSVTKDSGQHWVSPAELSGQWVTCVSRSNEGIFVGTRTGVFRTVDQGVHWGQFDGGLPKGTIRGMLPTSKGMLTYGDFGVYVLPNDGSTWVSYNDGLSRSAGTAIALLGPSLFASVGGVPYVSQTAGSTWQEVTSPDPSTGVWWLGTSRTQIFCASVNRVFRSYDDGVNWHEVDLPTLDKYALEITSVEKSDGAGEAAILAGVSFYNRQYSGLYRTTDGGSTWTKVLPFAVTSVTSSGSVSFVATESEGIFRSTNEGLSWQVVWNENLYIYHISADGNSVVATSAFGLYFSPDRGAQWSEIAPPTESHTDAFSLLLRDTTIYASFVPGVVHSLSLGERKWREKGNVIPASSINTLLATTTYLFGCSDRTIARIAL